MSRTPTRELHDLYITTAANALSAADIAVQPLQAISLCFAPACRVFRFTNSPAELLKALFDRLEEMRCGSS
jgi:hypothetical protein